MIRVACIGDSITWGFTIIRRGRNTYPAQLKKLLGKEWRVRNYGMNNACASFRSDLPYGLLPQYRQARRFKPDVVLMMLGTNDTKNFNWNLDQFRAGYERILDSFLSLDKQPKVYLMLPPHIVKHVSPEPFVLDETRLSESIIPIIESIAREKGLPLIDIHSVLVDDSLFNDGVHPNVEGAGIIARTVYEALTK